MPGITISRAARAAGVGVETLRFYERRGLIEQPAKPREGGYRTYPEDTIRQVRFIRRAQDLGFTLREITELLTLRNVNGADASDVQLLARAKLCDVDQKIERLQRIRDGLTELLEACPGKGTLRCCSIYWALEGETVTHGNGAQ